jgi:hypothetical protein
MLRVTDDHRRARIARRHGVHPDHRYDTIGAATSAMTALHATEPATPHLSLHARVRGLTVEDVDAALYEERSLVRTMAMRRTLFVVARDVLPAVAGCAGRRVAEAERRRLAREAGAIEGELGADWITAASEQIVDCLTGRELSTRELRDALPHLGGTFTAAPGTKWSTEVSIMSRLLTMLAAAGDVVRGRNAGHWRISRPLWTSMASWLGEDGTTIESEAACADVVGRWLWTFGPATEADLVWWLGSTKSVVRKSLSQVEAVQVMLEGGSTGWVLPADTEDLAAPPQAQSWVTLLPTLDPTTMGWRERAFYLDQAHTPYLFDSAGNGGTTVWVNGRIVGCWVQDADQRVRLILMEQISRDKRRQLHAEAARLDEFLRGEHITNVFASPQMKRQQIG